MFCINCSHATQVRNSRPSKKTPVIWRRRFCPQCGTTFTTYERPSLAENKSVQNPDSYASDTFNIGKLIQSIAAAFSHDEHKAQYDSLALAQTVEDSLSTDTVALTPQHIAQTTYVVLKRFDELAAIQYAAKHHLITNVRRRGRPSLSSPDL